MLALGPDVLILDEPTAGQDFAHYTEFMQFLRTLNADGTTVVLITHDMHLAVEYTDRVLVLSDGRLLADADPAVVLTDPDAHPSRRPRDHRTLRTGQALWSP